MHTLNSRERSCRLVRLAKRSSEGTRKCARASDKQNGARKQCDMFAVRVHRRDTVEVVDFQICAIKPTTIISPKFPLLLLFRSWMKEPDELVTTCGVPRTRRRNISWKKHNIVSSKTLCMELYSKLIHLRKLHEPIICDAVRDSYNFLILI